MESNQTKLKTSFKIFSMFHHLLVKT